MLSKRILTSGTSIEVNVEEAKGGHSQKDFSAKLSIANKEAQETHYWLRFLRDTDLIGHKLSQLLLADCEELLRIIGSIGKALMKKPKHGKK